MADATHATCDCCGSILLPLREPAGDAGSDGLCMLCESRAHERVRDADSEFLDKLSDAQLQLWYALTKGKLQCTVIITGGTHVTGELKLFGTRRLLRMVSPDHCPGYLADGAPAPTCERFFDFKDVVMWTRRLT